MTNEEAIKRFKYQDKHVSCKAHICDNDCEKCLEASKMLVYAAEKRNPMNTIKVYRKLWNGILFHVDVCPICGKMCGKIKGSRYCKECGQLLKGE